ncbi:hypothetical protein AWZ03_004724 [Drosophila navojoa]|uniref:CHK kinase-like domain-containing protein n=1 Tax=Drosophila navojoa TaxID=7232 RepID=A0A484BM56_DRONA|nr:hypothetical protein AWZ03_004724 [Drosophila navojoa]
MPTESECYDSDELDVPQWLNDHFFREILAEHFKIPELKVVDVNFLPACAKGDHCLSAMFRAVVEYETTKNNNASRISLIIKTMPEQEGPAKELLDESHIFKTEIEVYTKVLPKLEEILREVGDDTTFGASCIYHSLKPHQVMVFEDLLPLGYAIVRRFANAEELQAALTKLAKWHAVSFKLLKEQTKLFDHLQYDISTLPNILKQAHITQALGHFLNMLDNVESLKPYRKYFEQMHKKGNLIQNWVNILREYRDNRQENGYYVLCHGDFHLRNIMFRGVECLLIDFQMTHVGHMTNDIIYAMYALFDVEIRRERSDELINNYFQTFLNTLKQIGYQYRLPNLIEFRRQMFEKRDHDFLLIIAFLPLIKHFRNGSEDIVDDDQKLSQLYFQKEYLDDLEEMLPRMLHLGYFEET